MPTSSFGKRQGVAHIACYPLTKRIVPAFLMSGFASLFAHAPMSFFRKHRRIRLPEVAITGTLTKGRRDSAPQPSTGPFTVVAKDTRDDVTSASQQHRPQPPFVDPFPHKTPGLIDFQDIIRLRCWKRLPERGQRGDFFFDPVRQGVPGDAEDAADAAHTGTFLRGSEDLFPAFRAIILFRGQDPNGTAVFAEILLTAALISSVFYNVCTAAFATLMLNRRDDHLTIFFEDDFFDKKIRVSFTVYHYQNSLYNGLSER